LATIAGFGVLAFSSVPLLRSFGETVAPGALLVLVFSAMLSGIGKRVHARQDSGDTHAQARCAAAPGPTHAAAPPLESTRELR
jgi:hypothetical protein